LTKEIKARLLALPTLDVEIEGQRRPLMLAATQTATSLLRCFAGEARRLAYPLLSCEPSD
ncbi:MAG: type II CRISPR-associated endonuclease Cas1, partial [Porphyromonas sp.]|nr:type II CRISPR-associated endonuclease Cas1 [Porphyromonas sp.]